MTYTAEVLAPLFIAAVFMVFYELIERYDERRRAEGLRRWEERVNAEYREAARRETHAALGVPYSNSLSSPVGEGGTPSEAASACERVFGGGR